MEVNLSDFLAARLSSFTGINITDYQKKKISDYIENYPLRNRKKEQFFQSLSVDAPEFNDLINIITTNETYFFREQRQFEILEKEIFPKYAGKKMVIWSAACSTGEEAISLMVLAKKCGVDATVYASDVDSVALETFKEGVFDVISCRADGSKYFDLLKLYENREGRAMTFYPDFINQFNIFQCNLISDDTFPIPEKVDLIFLRNLFMYFDDEGRNIVNKKLVSLMNENSYLFYSMNETGCFDSKPHPKELKLHKLNKDFITYYLYSSNPPKPKSLTEHVPPFEESSVRKGASVL